MLAVEAGALGPLALEQRELVDEVVHERRALARVGLDAPRWVALACGWVLARLDFFVSFFVKEKRKVRGWVEFKKIRCHTVTVEHLMK